MRVAMSGIGRFRRSVALALTVLVAAALAPAYPAHADDPGRPAVQRSAKPVKGHQVKATPRRPDPATRRHAPPKASWPKAGSAEVTLSSAAAPALRAGKLPLRIGRPAAQVRSAQATSVPARVKVRVLNHATAQRSGVNGLLFSVERTDTTQTSDRVGVQVDYSSFVNAFGGSYGSRLRLVQLPSCALTTPDRPECRQVTSVPTRNNGETKALSADVSLAPASAGATVMAAVAGASSDKGDYKATSLSASATWQVGTQTGDFTWSYPMRVPPVPGDLTPKLAVSYSSGSVDGRTSNTNNQPSWLGEGFDLWSGYIERRYKSCSDDGAPKDQDGNDPGDECWGYDNASISLNGKAGELIPAGGDTWRMKDDDGTRIQKLTGADNGDDDGEYWKVTTTDGIQYFFGKEKVADGKAKTGSTWTVPVFGDDDNEPCHKDSGFADSWCQQAWRWNLDYVVDPHGNAVVYYYTPETNRYARDLKASDGTTYTRGGYLDHIEYGLRSDNLTAKPSAQVNFGTAERCIPDANFNCDKDQIGSHPDYWWDVPWDQNCADNTDCKDTSLNTIKASPTFWSRKRLTSVTTQILNPSGSGSYLDVDSWAMTQDWGLADVDRDLLLTSITHKGVYKGLTTTANDPVTLPSVTFQHVQLENRVDKLGDDVGPYVKYRLGTIYDESGGQIDVNYSAKECTTDALPTPETNTKRCFPTYWVPPDGSKDPKIDWFHKYVVAQVIQTDRTGHAPDIVTDYDYQGGAAWHFDDDDGLTKEKYKTWSQWRGYATVSVQSGGDNDMRTQTDHQYFRGMDGDRLNKDGGTKDVTVSDGEGGSPYPDTDARQGFELKTIAYLKPGGAITSKTINTVWTHETAKRVRSWGTTTANLTGTASTRTLTALDGGNWRETLLKNTFDDTTGLPTQVDDQGDTSTADDDRCTQTQYTTDTTAWMQKYPSRVETVAVKCGDPVERPKQVVSDVRSYYDNGAFDAAPSKGDITKVENIADYNGATPVYVTGATTGYDAYGRPSTVTDAAGHVTTTVYTPATGLPTSAKVTGPPVTPGDTSTALYTSSTLDPAWNLPTSQTDQGGKTTIQDYDALGRLIKVWLPNVTKSSNTIPNIAYTYITGENTAAAVETQTLRANLGVLTSYQIYDGFLRPRQTQALGPDGSRLISDTFYDAQGKTARTYAAYQADGAPSATLFGIDTPGNVETQTAYEYDGLGRVTTETLLAGGGLGQEKWHTTTSYSGDRVTVDPPTGGTPTTTIADARGQTTEVRQYKSDTPTGDYDATKYTYTPAGKLKTLTDAAGNTWTHTYDLRGREYQTDDPDKGTTKTTFNDLDQITSTEDARGKKLFYVYDPTGRKTEEHADSLTGPLLTTWVYDTIRRGQLASTTRYVGGAAYVATVNLYDNLNQPTRTTYTIPSVTGEEALAGSYQYNTKYNLDESVKSTGFPLVSQAPGMGVETVSYTYDDLNRPITTTGNTKLVTNTQYKPTGQLQQLELSNGGKRTWTNYSYEYGTQRLHESQTSRESIAGTDRDATYGYDDAGDVTSVTDVSRAGTDNQCFRYDHLQRLTEAWAPTEACSTGPDKTSLGGPAPYWSSYGYDATGNRTSETQHGVGAVAADTTRTYHYPDPGQGQHRLSSITQTGAAGNRTDNYGYDAAGNTTTRDIGNAHQTLSWDTEGHLTTTTDSTGSTSYAYDAGGNRLLRRDPTSTTVYLPDMELRLDKTTGKVSGTRYYDHGGSLVAVNTSGTIQFQAADPHGTAELSINGTTQALTQRRFTPFGQFRGTPTGIWPTDKGFVGGTIDPSGLTNLGARQYDPDTGRFISVDPVFDLGDPQSWNGYTYADDDPVGKSDPSGLKPDECGAGGSASACDAATGHGNYEDTYGGNGTGASTIGSPGAVTSVLSGWRITAPDIVFYNKAWAYAQRHMPQGKAPDFGCSKLGTSPDCFYLQPFTVDLFMDFLCKRAGISCQQLGPGPVQKSADALADDGLLTSHEGGGGHEPILGSRPPAGGLGRLPNAPSVCGVNSFVAGTQVLMDNGITKPIEKIKVGDRVMAADPKTGKTHPEPVTASFGGTNYTSLVKVTIEGNDRGGYQAGAVTATEHHKFWNPTRHAWTRADHLTPGTDLQAPNGQTIHVLRVLYVPTHPAVHDLTIYGVHTYYVLAGSTPVLVHNSGGACPRNADGTFASGAGGESEATAAGRLTHLNYKTALGDGYDYEFRLPSGGRPDAIDWQNRVVRELKSDAPSNVARGNRQLRRYQGELEEMTGQKWTTVLDIYKR
jgi:RHS repeat-associated protein